MDIVFATASAVVSHPDSGASVLVTHGTHWPADDPVALAYPSHFTDDPRFGLSSSRSLRDDGYPVGSESADAADAAAAKASGSTQSAVETTTAAPGERRARRTRE